MDERLDVCSVVGALGVLVDARAWGTLGDLFADEVRVDYVSLFGGVAEVLAREELMARWKALLPGFTRTSHVIGIPRVILEDTAAHADANVVARHVIDDPALAGNETWLVGGCYEIDLTKRHARWHIVALTLARAWAEGNLDLPRIAAERAKKYG